MRAAIRSGLLGTTLSFVKDYPIPPLDASSKTDANHVLIKVKAASINPVDYKLPRVLGGKVVGIDFCGTIEAMGSNVNNSRDEEYKVGDDVFGTCMSGSLAEYCIADCDSIAKVLPSASDKNDENSVQWSCLEYAALPVAYMSTLQSLRIGNINPPTSDNGDINAEKAVLVIGASGGCGIAGIQLCKAMGVGRIVGICSDRNLELVKNMGATEVISYSDASQLQYFFDSNQGQFDCVYDAATGSGAGEDYWTMSLSLLKTTTDNAERNSDKGQYVALNGPAMKWIRALSGKQKPNESIMMMKSNSEDLSSIAKLLSRINEKPITNIIPFNEQGFEDAFKQLKSRRTKGKLVFDMII